MEKITKIHTTFQHTVAAPMMLRLISFLPIQIQAKKTSTHTGHTMMVGCQMTNL